MDIYVSPGGSPTPDSNFEVDLEHDGTEIQVMESMDQVAGPSVQELVDQDFLEGEVI